MINPGLAGLTQGTANRYILLVGGENFSNRADVTLGPVSGSLQGPGGISTLRFTVMQTSTGSMAPFQGRRPVLFYDSQSDLRFKGFIVHTRFRRLQGSKRAIDVDCAGLDALLDYRLEISFKTRPDTTSRVRKFANDDDLVKAILKDGNLDDMIGVYINRTSTDMDDMHFQGQTIRECLTEIADVAQPETSYLVRRFYVDVNGLLHYYSGGEGLQAPFRVSEDERYINTMGSASGIVSFWSGRLNNAGDAYDHLAYANATVNGGISSEASLCVGNPELPGMRFNGSTGYLSPSGANLHPGNTGTWGCVFKRRATGSQQALISGGSTDILIGFDATDHIRVQKEGTGDAFVSTATYADTTNAYHLVVTHSPGNQTLVYVNGSLVTGTTTAQTFSAGSATINIGRKKSTTDQFYAGRLWGVWVGSTETSAAAVATQMKVWQSIEPEGLVIDRDSTDVTRQVWVKGSNDAGTGWVIPPAVSDPQFEGIIGPADGGPVLTQEYIDRPDSDTARKRNKYGNAYMSAKAGTVVSATFTLSYDPALIQRSGIPSTWRPGQAVHITSQTAEGWTNEVLEIKQVDFDILGATGETKFDVTVGALPYSALRNIRSRGMS